MTNLAVKNRSMLFLFASFAHHLHAHAQLQRVPPATAVDVVRRLDTKKLPPNSGFTINPKEVFLLKLRGVGNLYLNPIVFEHENDLNPAQCGIIFLDAAGTTDYASLSGPEDINHCLESIALGTVTGEGPYPQILALFTVAVPSNAEYTYPFLLRWNVGANRYVLDERTSNWLAEQAHSDSIASCRRLLKQHH